ncbi:MAG: hypothetical protein AAFY26_00840 [Cyanobacteria bacterium J06638_22]
MGTLAFTTGWAGAEPVDRSDIEAAKTVTPTSFVPSEGGDLDLGGIFDGGGGFDWGGIGGDIMNGGGFGDYLGDLFGDYQQMATDVFEEYSDRWLGDWAGGLGDIFGELGIPDFGTYAEDLAEKVFGTGDGEIAEEMAEQDGFNSNPVALAQSLEHELTRASSRALAQTVLGEEGQQATLEQMEVMNQSVQMIHAKAEEAQGLDVTQDVMKAMTEMLAGNAQLDMLTATQLTFLTQQSAMTNMVLPDLSSAIDEANRAQRAETIGTAAAAARGTAVIYLPGVGRDAEAPD